MGRSAFYSVASYNAKDGVCKVRVRARDVDAKQVLWGWGSDKRPSIEFYGRGTGRGGGDSEVWQWDLSPAAVKELKRNLKTQIRDPSYEASDRENKAAMQLLRKIGTRVCRRR